MQLKIAVNPMTVKLLQTISSLLHLSHLPNVCGNSQAV